MTFKFGMDMREKLVDEFFIRSLTPKAHAVKRRTLDKYGILKILAKDKTSDEYEDHCEQEDEYEDQEIPKFDLKVLTMLGLHFYYEKNKITKWVNMTICCFMFPCEIVRLNFLVLTG